VLVISFSGPAAAASGIRAEKGGKQRPFMVLGRKWGLDCESIRKLRVTSSSGRSRPRERKKKKLGKIELLTPTRGAAGVWEKLLSNRSGYIT